MDKQDTVATIRGKLKQVGFGNITQVASDMRQTRTYRGRDGKMLLGVKLWNEGPTTVSDLGRSVGMRNKAGLLRQLSDRNVIILHNGEEVVNLRYLGKNYRLAITAIPTHVHAMNRDKQYVTYWLTFAGEVK